MSEERKFPLEYILEPCKTPEELDRYLLDVLDVELPWDTVDDLSTSSPLKFVWGVYQHMLTGEGPTRHVLACARNSMKTLTSSIIQYFSLLHFRRNGLQIAATIEQSQQSISYLDHFILKAEVKQFQQSDNTRVKRFVSLPANTFTTKDNVVLRVVAATKKGSNSSRASTICLDECDLVPEEIISEVSYVADPSLVTMPDGRTEKRNPIYVYLSSRKSNTGPIQALIDECEASTKEGFKKPRLHKWALVDMMEACPSELHKADLPKINAYVNQETLETKFGDENFGIIPDSIKSKYIQYPAYEGCRTCSAWVACLGRSPKQRGTSRALRTADFVGDLMASVKSPAAIIAQALNWKPESTGLVFQQFSVGTHFKAPRDFYEFVTFGKQYNPDNLTEEKINQILDEGSYSEVLRLTPNKDIIYRTMVACGWKISAGIDWGFTDPAICSIQGYHKDRKRLVTLHVEHAFGYANHLWAKYCAENIFDRFPVDFVGPDTADPSAPGYFAPYGIRALDKKPAKIATGVSFIRGMLWDAVSQESRYAILDDGETENSNGFAIEEFKTYAHARDPLGRVITDKFEDTNNHFLDSHRYSTAPYVNESKTSVSTSQQAPAITMDQAIKANDYALVSQAQEQLKTQNVMQDYFAKEHGLVNVFGNNQTDKPKKKSSIKFSI